MTGIISIFNRHIMEAAEEQKKKRYPYHKKYVRAAARMAPVGALAGAGYAVKDPIKKTVRSYKQFKRSGILSEKELITGAIRNFNHYRPSMKVIGKKALAGAAIGAGIGVGAKALQKHRDKVTVAKGAYNLKKRYDTI